PLSRLRERVADEVGGERVLHACLPPPLPSPPSGGGGGEGGDHMPLGVLMLDTRFARFVGDIGNPDSYQQPVLFEVVRGATVDKVVPAKAPPLIEDFVAAGNRLIDRGADAITTGCGFLVLNQAELAARLPVPVATSALLLIPTLLKLLPSGRRLGVLTFSARDLTPAHFVAAGAPADTPVEGVAQDGVFQKAIYEQP